MSIMTSMMSGHSGCDMTVGQAPATLLLRFVIVTFDDDDIARYMSEVRETVPHADSPQLGGE
jgi:hypothetical protein